MADMGQLRREELIDAGLVGPRSPSVAERRKVMDALEAHYDIRGECYSGDKSDQALADALNVPRAWVMEIRRQFFGEGEGNETAANVLADIEALQKEVRALVGRAGQLEGKAEALKAQAKKYLEGKR